MSGLNPAALDWLRTHHGVITAARLRSFDVSTSTYRRLVDEGELRAPYKGVYALATAAATLEHRCAALSAAHQRGMITGPTAGALLGLRRMPRTAGLHLAVTHGCRLDSVAGVILRQTTRLAAADSTLRADGIRVASAARLAFDLAADLSDLDHVSVLNQLVDARHVTTEELARIERRLGHPARRGSGRMARSLARLGGAASQSHPEVVLGEALRRRGVPVEAQSRVVSVGGRNVHVDLAVPAARWGIELDIHPEHRTIDGHARDASRYRGLHLADWQIEPVAEADMADLARLVDELADLYARRVRAVA